MPGEPARPEGQRKRHSPRLTGEIDDHEDKKSARWSEEIEGDHDAKIRETWAFQRLETFQIEVFPNGFPPSIDLNTVSCELHRSQHSDPHTHPITLLWRDNEDDIRAFGRAVSASTSWRDVVRGPAPLLIPAIGGEDEIMALAVLFHGCAMSGWLDKLWKLMRLDWVVYPDTHPKGAKPEFWAGVKLSRGGDYQEEWPQGHRRRLHCDISTLLGLTPATDDSSNESDDATKHIKKRKVAKRRRSRKSKTDQVDSDDEPLLGQGKRQEKAKEVNNMAMFVRLLPKLDQDRKEDKVWKRKLDLKLEKFQKEYVMGLGNRSWSSRSINSRRILSRTARGTSNFVRR